MTTVDFGRYSEDYAAFRPGPPGSFYDRLEAVARISGSHALDLGTGPGTVALELAARGSDVVGVDISPELIAVAERVSRQRELDDCARFQVAPAENTGLVSNACDLVTASQCWHWFDAGATLKEVRRVLCTGGLLAIVYYSYLSEHSAVARDSERLVLEFNPSWRMAGSNGMFPEHTDDVIRGGFQFVEAFCYDHEEGFSHAGWRGRMRTCNGVGGVLSPEEVERFDEALACLLRDRYPDPVFVQHRLWCVAARKPP